jgi:hypothetical protein
MSSVTDRFKSLGLDEEGFFPLVRDLEPDHQHPAYETGARMKLVGLECAMKTGTLYARIRPKHHETDEDAFLIALDKLF